MQDKSPTHNVEKGLSLFQRSNSPYWFVVYQHAGKKIKRSTKVAHKRGARGISEASRIARSFREASRATAQACSDVSGGRLLGLGDLERLDRIRFLKRKQVKLNALGEPLPGPNFDSALTLWENDPEQSWRALRRHLEADDTVCDPLALTPKHVESFIEACSARGAKPQSWKRYLLVLKRGLELLCKDSAEAMPIDDKAWEVWFDVADAPKDEKKRGKARSNDELCQLLDELGRDTEIADQLIVAAHTAARKHEVLRLRIESVVVPPNATPERPAVLAIEGRKGGSEIRYVAINAECFAAVQRQIVRRAAGGTSRMGPLWSGANFRKRIETVCKRLGMTHNVTFRDLRATWASEADWAEADTKMQRMRQMGHTNEKTHDIYVKGIEAVKIRRAMAVRFERPSLSGPTLGPTGVSGK